MELTTVKGIIAVTLSVDASNKEHLLGLSPQELLRLSSDELAMITLPAHIQDAVVNYDGETIQIIFSI